MCLSLLLVTTILWLPTSAPSPPESSHSPIARAGAAQQRRAAQEAKLKPGEPQPSARAATAVALFGDFAAFGAPFDSSIQPSSGAVHLFERTEEGWGERQKLTMAQPRAGGFFGRALAMSNEILVVAGRRFSSASGSVTGAVFIYSRHGRTWVETQVIDPPGANIDSFGLSLALQGNRLIVTAPVDKGDQRTTGSGAVYSYSLQGRRWRLDQRLTPPGSGRGVLFGSCAALSGNTLVLGALGDRIRPPRTGVAGAAYVYSLQEDEWMLQQKLKPGNEQQGSSFGASCAVLGGTILIGSPDRTFAGTPNGSVFVYTFDGTLWLQEQNLSATRRGASNAFGTSVALLPDTAIIGSPFHNGLPRIAATGAIYLFERTNARWAQTQKRVASDAGQFDLLGKSLSLSGGTILVGASGESGGAPSSGAAYTYVVTPSTVASRNASSNPQSYSASIPVRGKEWTATVDLSTTGHTLALIRGFSAPAAHPLAGGQVLLVGGLHLFTLDPAPGPLASFQARIPGDLSLIGRTFHTQAVHFGGLEAFALSNAQDLTVGF